MIQRETREVQRGRDGDDETRSGHGRELNNGSTVEDQIGDRNRGDRARGVTRSL